MFWTLPALVSLATAIFWAVVASSQDSSGSGMVLLFFGVPLIALNVCIWLLYFILVSFFGAW